MAISTWLAVLKTNVEGVEGMDSVYTHEDLPRVIEGETAGVILPLGVPNPEYSTGGPCLMFWRMQITVYVAGEHTAEAMKLAVPFIERMRDKLAGDMKLGGNVEHILPDLKEGWCEGPGMIDYMGKRLPGVLFRYQVKENVTGDFVVAA